MARRAKHKPACTGGSLLARGRTAEEQGRLCLHHTHDRDHTDRRARERAGRRDRAARRAVPRGREGTIRQKLIEENLLDAVIGLPANLFFGTGIPAAILIFKRHKPDDDVMFIDASRDFAPGTNQNKLRRADTDRIVSAYRTREIVEKYAYRATFAEIEANGFNLNIPRYVDTFEAEERIDVAVVQREIDDLQAQLGDVQARMAAYLREMGLT